MLAIIRKLINGWKIIDAEVIELPLSSITLPRKLKRLI